ncbi:enoyl-CoA hydratase/isomerase family protein [Mycobacterium syngnathidarum]
MAYDLPEGVEIRADGPVRIVEFTRPDRLNAVSGEIHEKFARIWRELERDQDAGAVVITGSGKAFSAGGDMNWFQGLRDDHGARRLAALDGGEIVKEMMRLRLPVVAAVNGPAVGLGCSIAMCADLVVIADDTYLADPHVSIGVVAGDGGAALWPWLTSMRFAKEFLYLGDPIPAALALQIGMVNRVVPREAVLPEALALAHRLAGQPAWAVQDTKRALHMHMTHALGAVLDFSTAVEIHSFLSEDHKERVSAFLTKEKNMEKTR